MEPVTVGIETLEVNGDNTQEDVVTPWTVESTSETGIDYDKLISEYNFKKLKIYILIEKLI